MEEILSSIRRIIADEEAEEADGVSAIEDADPDAPQSGLEALDTDEQDHADMTDDGPDDVLELTRIVRESGEVVDLRAESPGQTDFDRDAPDGLRDQEEAELTPPEDVPEKAPAATMDEHAKQKDRTTVHSKHADGEDLISASTASLATGAFVKLSSAFQRTPTEDSVADTDGRTIEQFVEDMVRPMLKEWLDERMPPLIERIVEREIQKIARRAELL